ncbi:hypothetical protein [Roseococcus pinisoli]|uniref:Uncharacterized protein n=1 Tax=Roseococcus pinisoli TaxID=2835040 RepID=A0ABS5QBS2_9PROT|nr:hypothetical protein [Roseococcus pinisoli]MBS7810382.1 hypothetical protein [Roseococcus pinisoli]
MDRSYEPRLPLFWMMLATGVIAAPLLSGALGFAASVGEPEVDSWRDAGLRVSILDVASADGMPQNR